MAKSQFKQWLLDKIIEGRNVRLPQNMNIVELAMDIAANGLNKRPEVITVKNGNVEIITGHRRIRAVKWLQVNDPVAYATHFKNNMVEVEVLQGISYEQAQFLKIDHGNEQPLRGLELQNCANMLFDYELSEKQVVVRLATLLDTVMPMKANKRKKLDELRTQLEQLIAVNADPKLVAAKDAEIITFIFEYRRGAVQNLHNVYRCPEIVMAALYFKETGDHPDGFEKSVLPARITTADCTKLYKAFTADLEEVDANGARKFNKVQPGPVFDAKWKEVLADSQEKVDAKPGDRQKSKSHKDLVAEAKSKWNSTGFQLLTRYHASEEIEVSILKQEDALLFIAEIISERAPEEWADIVKLSKGLVKEVAAETKEVEAKKQATS